jgi:hypothetical protein
MVGSSCFDLCQGDIAQRPIFDAAVKHLFAYGQTAGEVLIPT